MGITDRVALSDGNFIPRRLTDRGAVARLQRRIERCKKNSKGQIKLYHQFGRLKFREAVRNRNECHRITTEIVRCYSFIAAENLRIPNMTRSAKGTLEEPGKNVAAKSGLNRSALEQTWGVILNQLEYKADWYGRTFVKVDPKHTSQECSGCGFVDSGNRDRKYRKRFVCQSCGMVADADTNAARNVLVAGLEIET